MTPERRARAWRTHTGSPFLVEQVRDLSPDVLAEPSGPATEAGMAASLGTAIHASIEDLLNMDISDRPKASMGWLPEVGEAFLKDRWNEEKDAFHATPRHGRWKDDRWKEAVDGHRGGIDLLLRWVGVEGLSHERITAALGLGFRSG